MTGFLFEMLGLSFPFKGESVTQLSQQRQIVYLSIVRGLRWLKLEDSAPRVVKSA